MFCQEVVDALASLCLADSNLTGVVFVSLHIQLKVFCRWSFVVSRLFVANVDERQMTKDQRPN